MGPDRMQPGERRPLTAGERARLSRGLVSALDAAGVEPIIVAKASPGARIAGLWRGVVPIMAWKGRIFWPGARTDFSLSKRPGEMAILQHELQHVLEFATGELTVLGYACNPRNWSYRYRLDQRLSWADYGAEQRAHIVEDLWRLEHGLGPHGAIAGPYQELIPWCDEDKRKRPGEDLRGVHALMPRWLRKSAG